MAAFIHLAIENIKRLVGQLLRRSLASKTNDNGSFTIGYKAPYAIFVHENLAAHHAHGQAKYLEQPARQLQSDLAVNIQRDMASGVSLNQANQSAAIKLYEASQELVPTETGVLKASGYVKDNHEQIIIGGEEDSATLAAWRGYLKDRVRRQLPIDLKELTES